MPLSALALLRPSTRCLAARPAAPSALPLLRPRYSLAAIALHRHRSTSADKPDDEGAGAKRPGSQPDVSFRQFAGRALGVSLRNLALALSPRGIRQAYRENPSLTTMNILLLLFTLALSAVAVRSYVNTFYGAEFGRYPEPVANTLRRAVYYTNVKPEPELALKYYKRAMEQCGEVGLDPFSDEVLGIRIQVAYWLQKIGSFKAAIDVLESVLADCRRWVDVMEQSVRDGKVDDKGRYTGPPPTPTPTHTPTPTPTSTTTATATATATTTTDDISTAAEKDGEAETLWAKRQRLLAKSISISVKLGELEVASPDAAHAHLVWAVETALSELQRRRDTGTRPGETGWLRPEELGGAIESLGRDYERRSQFGLAIPLFFQALRLCESPCHRAVIMNNLAASFAQSPGATPGTSETTARARATAATKSLDTVLEADMPKTRRECLEAGLNWARNAYEHARDVRGQARTGECDEACAVALCNWGDVAAMLGRREEARRRYEECVRVSTEGGFADGEVHAREGLAKLAAGERRVSV